MSLSKKTIAAFVAILALPTIIFSSYLVFVICATPNWRTQLGTFGDSFGVVNALFSGLTFAGLLITLIQQREEISLQHRELIETRKQFERSATAQEQTAKLNAYTSLLGEYSARIEALSAANNEFRERRSRELSGNRPDLHAAALMAGTPYDAELQGLGKRKSSIVEELERYLATQSPPAKPQ